MIAVANDSTLHALVRTYVMYRTMGDDREKLANRMLRACSSELGEAILSAWQLNGGMTLGNGQGDPVWGLLDDLWMHMFRVLRKESIGRANFT